MKALNLMPAITIVVLIFFSTGCVGIYRTPDPVPPTEKNDQDKSCTELKQDLVNSKAKLKDLRSSQNGKVGANIVAGVLGILVPPIWFLMDVSNVDTINIEAQEKRNKVLTEIARKKGCGI